MMIIVASDSITDGATGLVGKRGDTAMRELFFSFESKIRKNDQKKWQYMLNVIPHIFSLINFCVRTSFFYNRITQYFFNIRNQSILYNEFAVFRTNSSGIV